MRLTGAKFSAHIQQKDSDKTMTLGAGGAQRKIIRQQHICIQYGKTCLSQSQRPESILHSFQLEVSTCGHATA